MSIKVGDQAPDFTLVTKTAEGPSLVKLSDLIGKSNIVLLFVPMAFTGVCTTEFCDISAGISEYEALEAKVIGNPANWKKMSRPKASTHLWKARLPATLVGTHLIEVRETDMHGRVTTSQRVVRIAAAALAPK